MPIDLMITGHTYRADIDGLRAVAVVAVVLYHFGFSLFSGGFVGVDIFFVISGFVITSSIAHQIAGGDFSLLGFYDRRIRRILPALTVVTASSLAVGYFLLLPGDYESLGQQAIYAVFGASNFYFLFNTGYFDQAAELMPLLHTWSLGVEEQFYFLWPLTVVAIAACLRKAAFAATVALLIIITVSLAWAVYDVSVAGRQAVAFYMLHARAWELGLGALLVFLPAVRQRWQSEVCAAAGISLIVGSIFFLDSASQFPGANAIYPCLGAALVIGARSEASVVSRLLSLRPVVFVGLISYSLYLWHWPLLAYYRFYFSGSAPSLIEGAGLFLIAIALSCLTWRIVEKPFRKLRIAPRISVPVGLATSFAVAALGFGIVQSGGAVQRISHDMEPVKNLDVMWKWDCEKRQFEGLGNVCLFGANWDTATRRAFLFGDSHAEHLVPVLDAAYGSNTAILLYRGCAPMIGGSVKLATPNGEAYNQRCSAKRRRAVEFLRAHPDISLVILAGRWVNKILNLYSKTAVKTSAASGERLLAEGLAEVFASADVANRSFVVVGPLPYWRHDPVQCLAGQSQAILRAPCRLFVPSAEFWRVHESTHRALKAAAEAFPNVSIINPGERLCREERCIATVGGELIYRDITHLRRNLREATNRELAKALGFPVEQRKEARSPNLTAAPLDIP